ncbi:hypothetical protein SLS60_009654 [Paraconiothyrium brasiliense]|uniref:Uncharacterized protein n=1 Tax=Paraconiothyrium brasiliense TaxID=300254 RepID=A0ABR3QVN5_9PLEO
MPGSSDPNIMICDQYGGPRLEPVHLPLARALILLDVEMLRRVQKFYQKRTLPADDARKAKAGPLLKDCNDAMRQWKEINSGKRQFSHSYLKNGHFDRIWAEGLRIITEALRRNQPSNNQSQKQSFERILHKCDTLASELMSQMVDVAHQGLLDATVFWSIQARWLRLDEVLNWYYDLCNLDADESEQRVSRVSPTWLVDN